MRKFLMLILVVLIWGVIQIAKADDATPGTVTSTIDTVGSAIQKYPYVIGSAYLLREHQARQFNDYIPLSWQSKTHALANVSFGIGYAPGDCIVPNALYKMNAVLSKSFKWIEKTFNVSYPSAENYLATSPIYVFAGPAYVIGDKKHWDGVIGIGGKF